MVRSRTKNVTVNISAALICQVLNLCLNFISRTFFIQYLGAVYLGVNGLFANILSILSFAELGIGNALVFSMYKPLSTNDTPKLLSLMSLYKKAYHFIALVVSILGLLYIPFIKYTIKDRPDIPENLTIIYLLFLFNTVASYLIVYKKSILIADQKNYLVLVSTEIAHVLQIVIQILVIILFESFIGFLIIQIIFTSVGNIIAARTANKKYPFLKNKSQPLDVIERKEIFKNIRSMSAYKFGSIILNSTDNVIVSTMVGVLQVGIVSNYVLLYQAVNSILGSITNSFTASIGNLNASGTIDKKFDVFNKVLFITIWLYGFASMGLVFLSQELIPIWVGKEYLLDFPTVCAIMFGFYIFGVHSVESHYRTTMGFFVKGRFAPIASAILNLVLSVLLCKWIGLIGVFIATPIARMSFIGVVDTIIIYKYGFKKNPWLYYRDNLIYIFIIIIIGCLSYFCYDLIIIEGWIGFILKIIVFTFVFNILMIILFYKTRHFQDIIKMFKMIIKK